MEITYEYNKKVIVKVQKMTYATMVGAFKSFH